LGIRGRCLLLSRKSLGHLATLDSLEARAKNEASRATANTRRHKAQNLKIFLRNRNRGHDVVKVANMNAREAAHSKDKREARLAQQGCMLARASRTKRTVGMVDEKWEQSDALHIFFNRSIA
jgi:hypothetical protein